MSDRIEKTEKNIEKEENLEKIIKDEHLEINNHEEDVRIESYKADSGKYENKIEFERGNEVKRLSKNDSDIDFLREEKEAEKEDQDTGIFEVIGFINTFIGKLSKNRKHLKRKSIYDSMFLTQSKYNRTEMMQDILTSMTYNKANLNILYRVTSNVDQGNEPNFLRLTATSFLFDDSLSNMFYLKNYNVEDCLLNHEVLCQGKQFYKTKWEKMEVEDTLYVNKERSFQSCYKSVHDYIDRINICGVLTGEFIIARLLEQCIRVFTSDYNVVIWSNPTMLYDTFCRNSQTHIEHIIYTVNELEHNFLNQLYCFVIRSEDACCHTLTHSVAAIHLKQISYSRFPIVLKSRIEKYHTSFSVKIKFITRKEINVNKKTLIPQMIVGRFGLTSNNIFDTSLKDDSSTYSPCIEQCKPVCLCRLLKSCYKCINSDSFFLDLIDFWVFPKKKNDRKNVFNFSALENPQSKIQKYIENNQYLSNNSGDDVINFPVEQNSEAINNVLHSFHSKPEINISGESVDVKSLINILKYLQDIISTWSESVLIFDDLRPFLLRVLNSLKTVLKNISESIKNKRIIEISEACIKNTISVEKFKDNVIEILLQLCSMFNKINKLGKYLNQNRLVPASLTYSLYKLYCYYKKNDRCENPLKTIISFKSFISSKNLDSLFYSSETDRRIKSIEKKSNCIFNTQTTNNSGNEMTAEISSFPNNSDVKIKSVLDLFAKVLSPSRFRINYSNFKGESSMLRKMNWDDFKYI